MAFTFPTNPTNGQTAVQGGVTYTYSAVNDMWIGNTGGSGGPTTNITNGTSNVSIPVSDGNVNTSVGGVANVLVVTSTGANVSGTMQVTGNTQFTSGVSFGNAYTETIFPIPSSTTPALNPNNGTFQTWALTGASTPTAAASWANGQSMMLMVDDGSGSQIDWTSVPVIWETNNGQSPTLATSGFTTIALWKIGGAIYGARVGDA